MKLINKGIVGRERNVLGVLCGVGCTEVLLNQADMKIIIDQLTASPSTRNRAIALLMNLYYRMSTYDKDGKLIN